MLQACDSDEDGLFSFDMHSDGEGQRYFLSFNQNKLTYISQLRRVLFYFQTLERHNEGKGERRS